MGRATWIYQLHQDLAKERLHDILRAKDQYAISFRSFIRKRQEEFGAKYLVRYADIIRTVSGDINQIMPGQLFEITYWLDEVMDDGWGLEGGKNDQRFGINLLFESSTKSEAVGLMNVYYDYLDAFKRTKSFDPDFDNGIKTNTRELMRFLEFLVLLLDKIRLIDSVEVFDEYSALIRAEVNQISDQYKGHVKFERALENKVLVIKDLLKSITGEALHAQANSYAELHLIIRHAAFVDKALAIRRSILDRDACVIILDSI